MAKVESDGNGGAYIRWGWLGKTIGTLMIISIPAIIGTVSHLANQQDVIQAQSVDILRRLDRIELRLDADYHRTSASGIINFDDPPSIPRPSYPGLMLAGVSHSQAGSPTDPASANRESNSSGPS